MNYHPAAASSAPLRAPMDPLSHADQTESNDATWHTSAVELPLDVQVWRCAGVAMHGVQACSNLPHPRSSSHLRFYGRSSRQINIHTIHSLHPCVIHTGVIPELTY